MSGERLHLGVPEIAAVIDERYDQEPDGWRKRRLLAIKLAAKGEYTSAEVAEISDINRTWLFAWLKVVRSEGLEALLKREKPGPKPGPPREMKPEVYAALKEMVRTSEFNSAEQARRWLKEKHQVDRPYTTVWKWLKKLGGVLRVPRPSHSKKDPHAAEAFRSEVVEKLESLGLEKGSRVKVWFMDEARLGLHTPMRRVWTLRGVRPVVSRQIKYQWDYLYGALDAISGQAHFAHVPGVNLEWDQSYLANLAASDPSAVHVVVRDQAGFHLRDGDARLPERIRILHLPPYSPELNPCEQLWDILRDDLANRTYATITALRKRIKSTLQRFWADAQAVLRLIGRSWFTTQLNATPKSQLSV
jgi:transposase